ncbi:hypothetical protein EHI8A_103050 [Entamoeba histolytica HM-1:IMSS-B]|uniref:Uncharacterized protein n=5 Tax=Entamoeba histolytica TaxID=5759 RepID=C4LU96_ENTH1|nr:hypothetical protein EHI_110440 [Entamoeba histolytica HM-1:IMSS]EMH73463.1 hypothetical protein EHI8A_103050 [Entamoeba histolytica HM-1:IMSS-B]EMS12207.1 hypothetical protein KM1_107680 [Entamoeba histolytica HM-3:IMSS]ENY61091.1 hypothetical protein EHI7A_097600 [Entamoeba histolytica HM-1:IMSS-A]GAT92172.1 hypothetical protein CL6EHI_110440 [Entamoeba histolytica]EAL51670.1 hypothetical protein EHI_110440 [Entamoeba histolytica HM-1:IMSS]|eukprot:XP_657056.1 hypothetical protein EHI_110440 [Entamoeba histolytica HM-1:IMSS]
MSNDTKMKFVIFKDRVTKFAEWVDNDNPKNTTKKYKEYIEIVLSTTPKFFERMYCMFYPLDEQARCVLEEVVSSIDLFRMKESPSFTELRTVVNEIRPDLSPVLNKFLNYQVIYCVRHIPLISEFLNELKPDEYKIIQEKFQHFLKKTQFIVRTQKLVDLISQTYENSPKLSTNFTFSDIQKKYQWSELRLPISEIDLKQTKTNEIEQTIEPNVIKETNEIEQTKKPKLPLSLRKESDIIQPKQSVSTKVSSIDLSSVTQIPYKDISSNVEQIKELRYLDIDCKEITTDQKDEQIDSLLKCIKEKLNQNMQFSDTQQTEDVLKILSSLF